ncbi:DUF2732 family protein [Cronobacter malonaticus]
MRYPENLIVEMNSDALSALLSAARTEERHERGRAVSARLEALAIYITQHKMSGNEAAILLRGEAARIDSELEELH